MIPLAALAGINIHSSPLATRLVVAFTVERAGAPWKRRRRWRVVRHEQRVPAAFQLADGSLMLHPTLLAKLEREVPARPDRDLGGLGWFMPNRGRGVR